MSNESDELDIVSMSLFVEKLTRVVKAIGAMKVDIFVTRVC